MKREGIHGLIQYLNKTTNNATNTQVAKAIFTNRDKINEISLEKLAGDNYLSQASVSRFIKNQGYKNINEYRWDFIAGQQMLRLNAFNNKKVIISKNNEEIKNDVKQSLQDAFNDIDKLDMTALERLVKIINNYKQVLFIGSEFSLANIYLVQLEMVQYGINAYSYNDPIIMAENLRSLKEDTLIICISTSGQWYNAPSTKEIRDILFSLNNPKILLTCITQHTDEAKFDYIYKFGNQRNDEISGYIQLTYFIPIFRNMYIRYID